MNFVDTGHLGFPDISLGKKINTEGASGFYIEPEAHWAKKFVNGVIL